MPLLKTFQLSTKNGNQHWTRPVIDSIQKSVSFVVQNSPDGVPTSPTAADNGAAVCIACNEPVPSEYVQEQGKAGQVDEVLTAIVAEGKRKRLYLSPTEEHTRAASEANATWKPMETLPERALGFTVQGHGITEWNQMFTERQLLTQATLKELLDELTQTIMNDGATKRYAETVKVYLALGISKNADSGCRFARWQSTGEKIAGVFDMQTISMVYDFAETNPFSNSTQNWMAQITWIVKVLERLMTGVNEGAVYQADAATTIHASNGPVIVTDPPYYKNIGYADLSDFYYVWLRPLLRDLYPDLFAGILTPKNEEMVASPRYENTTQRFEDLLSKTLTLVRERCSPEFPSSIFYAYKQQEEEREGRSSTGWETMLTAVVNAGFHIVGTWPVRTERTGRSRQIASNALASSIVLVCRPRDQDAPTANRREFLDALERELPVALDQLTHEGHIAPVDLAQAAIGPGMQIYSRYNRVETISGTKSP